MNSAAVVVSKVGWSAIGAALTSGWHTTRCSLRVSLIYAGTVALVGLVIIRSLLSAGMAPLVPLSAAAFMLVAPMLLAGFFGVARAVENRNSANFKDLAAGFRQAPPVMLALSLVCALLFLIFITDVAILYSYKVGGTAVMALEMLSPSDNVVQVLLWGSVSGVVFCVIVFSISAFSVPLLCERRTGLVRAVMASVRGVFDNLAVTLTWAVLITLATIISIILLPLLPLTLPVLAYASHALYRQVFPA